MLYRRLPSPSRAPLASSSSGLSNLSVSRHRYSRCLRVELTFPFLIRRPIELDHLRPARDRQQGAGSASSHLSRLPHHPRSPQRLLLLRLLLLRANSQQLDRQPRRAAGARSQPQQLSRLDGFLRVVPVPRFALPPEAQLLGSLAPTERRVRDSPRPSPRRWCRRGHAQGTTETSSSYRFLCRERWEVDLRRW